MYPLFYNKQKPMKEEMPAADPPADAVVHDEHVVHEAPDPCLSHFLLANLRYLSFKT